MGKLVCKICGSSNFIMEPDGCQCTVCKMKYSLEAMRSMFGVNQDFAQQAESTASVDDRLEQMNKNLHFARVAKNKEDWEESEKYYKLVEMEDPSNLEAAFYSSYCKAMASLVNRDLYRRQAIFNVLTNAIRMIPDIYDIQRSAELEPIITQISDDIIAMACSKFVYNYTENGNGAVVSSDKSETVSLFITLHEQLCISCEQIMRQARSYSVPVVEFFCGIAFKQAEFVLVNDLLADPSVFRARLDSYRSLLLARFFNEHCNNGTVRFIDYSHVQFGSMNGIPIQWSILKKEGENSLLLISDTCFLRNEVPRAFLPRYRWNEAKAWLFEIFRGIAFSDAEQKMIRSTNGLPAISFPDRATVTAFLTDKVCCEHGTQTPVWWWAKAETSAHDRPIQHAYTPRGEYFERGYYTDDMRIHFRPLIRITF